MFFAVLLLPLYLCYCCNANDNDSGSILNLNTQYLWCAPCVRKYSCFFLLIHRFGRSHAFNSTTICIYLSIFTGYPRSLFSSLTKIFFFTLVFFAVCRFLSRNSYIVRKRQRNIQFFLILCRRWKKKLPKWKYVQYSENRVCVSFTKCIFK